MPELIIHDEKNITRHLDFLMRVLGLGFYLRNSIMKWITTAILAASLTPTLTNAQGCEAWLSPDFWARAGAVEVMGCTDRRVEERDENGASPLHLAAGYGFVAAVNALVLRDPDAVNRMDDRGYTPLHYAAESNANPEMISALLALGAVVDIRSEEDVSALDLAAGYAVDPEVLRRLLAAGAKASPVFDTISHAPEVPIMYAARYNSNPAILHVLLLEGADINATDQRGYGLLHMAIMSENQPEILAALLAIKADVNLQQMDGYTPLMEAIFSNAGAEALTLLIEAGAEVNTRDYFGAAALAHAAGRRGAPDFIRLLAAAGADVFAGDDYLNTAMHFAASQRDNLAVIKTLVELGGNINDMEEDRFTPLHMAVRGENAAMVEGMLALGANAAMPNNGGFYPYGEAMQNEVMQGTTTLEKLRLAVTPPPDEPAFCQAWQLREFWNSVTLKRVEACVPYVDINAPSDNSETPLMRAIRPDVDIAIIRVLLSAGSDLNLRDIAQSTALHFAVSADRDDLVALLLTRGANPNAADEAGQTPLHRATKLNAQAPIALILLKNGADPEILDHEGRAASDIELVFQPYSSGN
jgi:ankyrin repeat protein